MKHTASFFLVMLIVSSCQKDDPDTAIRYTSDVPNEFTTDLGVSYDQSENLTSASAFFQDEVPGSVAVSEDILKLPPNSYVNFNGEPMSSEYSGGTWLDKHVTGNSDGLFEFMNFDQTLYTNFVDVPDTFYLVNLPAIVDASQDLTLTFGGTPMESNETVRVYLGVNNDYGDFYEITADSTIVIPKSYLRPGQEQQLLLTRTKTISNPNLPIGGGKVGCSYKLSLMIYSE